MSAGSLKSAPALPAGAPRSRSILPALIAFVGLVWLTIQCLGPAAEFDWLGPVPRRNLELGIDAQALFYTEIDLETNVPVIGMMPDATAGDTEP